MKREEEVLRQEQDSLKDSDAAQLKEREIRLSGQIGEAEQEGFQKKVLVKRNPLQNLLHAGQIFLHLLPEKFVLLLLPFPGMLQGKKDQWIENFYLWEKQNQQLHLPEEVKQHTVQGIERYIHGTDFADSLPQGLNGLPVPGRDNQRVQNAHGKEGLLQAGRLFFLQPLPKIHGLIKLQVGNFLFRQKLPAAQGLRTALRLRILSGMPPR